MTQGGDAHYARATWDQFGDDYNLPKFDGVPQLFLIATLPRSGSHYLCHKMRSTGVLGCPLEYFSESRFADWCSRLDTEDPNEVLAYWYANRTSPNGLFGVKAHWPQFDWFQREKCSVVFPYTPVIRITRNDHIAQAISWNIAQQTESWISFKPAKGQPVYQFQGILAAYRAIENESACWQKFLDQSQRPLLELCYEDFVEDIEGALHEIARFLGVNEPISSNTGFPWMPQRQSAPTSQVWRERFMREAGEARVIL